MTPVNLNLNLRYRIADALDGVSDLPWRPNTEYDDRTFLRVTHATSVAAATAAEHLRKAASTSVLALFGE
ncbi:hypothetical protein [Halalkalicoccus salilacus]|uniref:hypothetical protein n=1 Tax=Halalkalicoccus salilacus TaxID=3117459 RepID=UPI00300E771A